MVINVDDEAMQTAIEELKPPTGGSALFEVTDIASPEHINARGITLGDYYEHTDSEERGVRVAITHFSEPQRKAIMAKGLPDSIDDYMDLPSPIAATPKQTQQTAVHELRHLVDSVDEAIVALREKDRDAVAIREKRHKRGMMAARKIIYGLAGVNIGASAFIWASPRIIMFGTSAVTGLTGLWYARKQEHEDAKAVNNFFKHYSYTASLAEKRARTAERRSKRYPQIIHIDRERDLTDNSS
jgi:hypothetical protein